MNAKKAKKYRKLAGFHPSQPREYVEIKHKRLTEKVVVTNIQVITKTDTPRSKYQEFKRFMKGDK